MSTVGWFAALCDDDYRWLGVPDPALRSSFEHCAEIVRCADRRGFDDVLLPSGYELGIDPVTFAAAVARSTERISLLTAVRCGELWPPQLARQLASLDEVLGAPGGPGTSGSRLEVNIISSDLPGAPLPSEPRYERTREVMSILRRLLAGEHVEHHGEFYDLELDAPRVARDMAERRGGPPSFHFGGLSPAARDVAADQADVFLMWPDTPQGIAAIIADMRARAAGHQRTLRFGLRIHVIVRATDGAARDAARELVSRLDDDEGDAIRRRSLDSGSVGVARQAELRDGADDDGYVSAHLWTGVGRARSGCGAAIVGDPDHVVAALREYEAVGVDSFILSGYPHRDECELVGEHVLAALQGRDG